MASKCHRFSAILGLKAGSNYSVVMLDGGLDYVFVRDDFWGIFPGKMGSGAVLLGAERRAILGADTARDQVIPAQRAAGTWEAVR